MLSHICLLLSLLQGWAMAQTSQDEVFICFQGKIHSEQSALALQFYTTLSSLVLTQPGFISQTPYYSIGQRGGQVLYVRFDNKEHLHAWKNLRVHLDIQAKGRADIFSDYRLRIGNEAFHGQPGDEDISTVSAGKYLLLWSYPTPSLAAEGGSLNARAMAPAVDGSVWQSLVDAETYVGETHTLRISSWPTKTVGLTVKDAILRVEGDDLRLIRVERDYGAFQRSEAPKDADRCQAAAAMNDTLALEQC